MIEGFPADLLDVALLRAKSGDVIICRARGRLTHEQARRLQEGLARVLPTGVKTIILDEEASIEAVPS